MIIEMCVRRNRKHWKAGFKELVILTRYGKRIVLRTQRKMSTLFSLFPDCFTAQEKQAILHKSFEADLPPDMQFIHEYEKHIHKEAIIARAAQSYNWC